MKIELKIEETLNALNSIVLVPVKVLRQYGCFVTKVNHLWFTAPMLKDGSVDMIGADINWSEVTDPVENFIADAEKEFGIDQRKEEGE